jgi:hypothetical protein
MRQYVEENHDYIAAMCQWYAKNLAAERVRDNFAPPLDRFLAAVVYY